MKKTHVFNTINHLGFDEKKNVPGKDLYIMNLCFGVNLRSIDESSKCGCIAVAEDGAILSTGYNNPIRGADDMSVPQTRPEKYSYMEHSERNLIYNAARHGAQLDKCIFYITGFPCIDCLRAMIQSGGKKIVYGPLQTAMFTEFTVYETLLKKQPIVIERFKYDDGLYLLNKRAEETVEKKEEAGISDINFEWNK